MKVYEFRSVMNGKPKKITAIQNLVICLQEYKKLMQKNNLPVDELDLFYAGYILANPVIREKLLKQRKREMKNNEEIRCIY